MCILGVTSGVVTKLVAGLKMCKDSAFTNKSSAAAAILFFLGASFLYYMNPSNPVLQEAEKEAEKIVEDVIKEEIAEENKEKEQNTDAKPAVDIKPAANTNKK